MVVFQNRTMQELHAHAIKEYPQECCGVLLGMTDGEKRGVVEVIPVENTAKDNRKQAHFFINPLEFVRIEELAAENGLKIIGFYHSHPDCEAQVSDEDTAHMICGYSYPIVSVRKGKCRSVNSYEKTSYQGVSIQREIIRTEEDLK